MKAIPSLSSSAFLSTSSPSCDYHHVVVYSSNSSCCWDATEPGAWAAAAPPHTIEHHPAAEDDLAPASQQFSSSTSESEDDDDEDDCWVWTPPAISLKSVHEQRQDLSTSSSAATAEFETERRGAAAWHDWNNPAFHCVPGVRAVATTTMFYAKPSSMMLDNCDMGEQVGEAVFNRALVGNV